MADVFFKDTAQGKLLNSSSGMMRGLTLATFGTSHCTNNSGLGPTVRDALWRGYDADITWYHRGVFTSNTDNTIIANPGQTYATGSANSTHVDTVQRPKFLEDVAAGKRADLMITDFGAANDSPNTQADLDAIMVKADRLLTDFFNPNGNKGLAALVWGMLPNAAPSIIQSWTAMWRAKERTSGGRIRFADATSLVADRAATTDTAFAFRGGFGSFGSASTDSVHISEYGSRLASPLVRDFLRDVCPHLYTPGPTFASTTYDPVNRKWASLLGTGAAMLGTTGLVSGTGASGTMPGTGSGTDRWNLTFVRGGSSTMTIAASVGATGPNGEREISLALGGTAQNGDLAIISYFPGVSNVNAGVASRKHNMGMEIEFVAAQGFVSTWLLAMADSNWSTPLNYNPGPYDAPPGPLSEVWKCRSLYPVAWTGTNPEFRQLIQFRAGAASGTIKLRRPQLDLVEE